MNKNSVELFTKTSRTALTGFESIYSFRKVAKLGVKNCTSQLHLESIGVAHKIAIDPSFDKYFIDRPAVIERIGGINKWAENMTSSQLEQFYSSVDSASLIFAHSILDGIAFDFCSTAALGFPESWKPFIENKKIPMREVLASTSEEIQESLIKTDLEHLEKESLLTKSDRLFAICQPDSTFDPLESYKFDRKNLKKLDELRHKIVHHPENLIKIPTIENDLEFLEKTGLFYMSLINYRFDFRCDTDAFFQ